MQQINEIMDNGTIIVGGGGGQTIVAAFWGKGRRENDCGRNWGKGWWVDASIPSLLVLTGL